MSGVIKIENLQSEVSKLLENYTDDVNDIVREETGKAVKYAVKELRKNSPKLTGFYAKNWKASITSSRYRAGAIAYNDETYPLSHLLEFGHANANGGRSASGSTPAHPHIAKVNEATTKMFYEGVVKRL